MNRISPRTALLMTLPPVLWAGNAVVGRMMVGSVPPMTLNFLRWLIASLILLPLGWRVLREPRAIIDRWPHLLLIGTLAMSTYNAAGDLYILGAVIAWAIYSWLLARPPASMRAPERPDWDWAGFLLVQILFGLIGAAGAAAAEVALGAAPIVWSGGVVAALLFVAIGPGLIAYRCWGLGVARGGPALAAFFANLTPLFAALMSAAVLGEAPRWFHALAFALIVAGILVSSRTTRPNARYTP